MSEETTMSIYKVISALLDYPDEELRAHLPEIRDYLAAARDVTEDERRHVGEVLDWMAGLDTLALQEHYVQTFDLTAEHSLHLTHHLFGDDRGRGPALVDLGEHYKGEGLAAVEGELPDYLPLILEYVSTLDDMAAHVFLHDALKVLEVLAANLDKAGTPYAALVRIIEARGRLARAAA
jgi:nitrate reductase delta subunit